MLFVSPWGGAGGECSGPTGTTFPGSAKSVLQPTLAKEYVLSASLVVQWLRICLPMQGTQVRALVWEDPTCCGATNPVRHNY